MNVPPLTTTEGAFCYLLATIVGLAGAIGLYVAVTGLL